MPDAPAVISPDDKAALRTSSGVYIGVPSGFFISDRVA